ncbi:MAG: chorismate lyase [Pseudomonadales bacterium]
MSRASRDPILHDWVSLRSSVTAALCHTFGASPQVTVLHEGGCALADWEAAMLQLPANASGFGRHVALRAAARTCVLARTAVAHDGPLRRILAALGSRPLGQRLFEDGDWQVIGLPVYLDDGLGNAGRAVCWQHVPTGAFLVVQELFLREAFAGRVLREIPGKRIFSP